MEDIVIQTHDFEEEKKQIKKFSNDVPKELSLDTFRTSEGLFDLFDHKVTGYELNRFVNQVQDYLVSFNERDKTFFKEFGHVYKAFESLDKDYIQAILISVKSAEEASSQALDAQKDADSAIKALDKIVKKLQEFKERMDTFQHLSDVDNIWKENGRLSSELSSIKKKSEGDIKEANKKISKLTDFQNRLSQNSHLYEVDEIWGTANAAKNRLEEYKNNLEKLIDKANEEINALKDFQQDISRYEHLKEIDNIWNDVKKINEHLKKLADSESELSERLKKAEEQINTLKEDLQSYKTGIEQQFKSQTDILNGLSEKVNKNSDRVATLEDLKNKINSLHHFDEVDTLWENHQKLDSLVKDNSKKINDQYSSLCSDFSKYKEENSDYQSKTDNALSVHEENLKDISEKIINEKDNLVKTNEELLVKLNVTEKKLKVAYVIGGGALALTIVQFVLNIIGVL